MAVAYLKLEALKAMLPIAATSDCRYYLNGVRVLAEPGCTSMEATNGHIAAIHQQEVAEGLNQGFADVILPVGKVKMLLAACPKGLSHVPVTVSYVCGDNLVRRVDVPNAGMSFDSIDGVFPDLIRMIPTKVSGEVAHFNPDLLSAFVKSAKALGSRAEAVAIGHNGTGPALVSVGRDSEFLGIIMPLRGDPVHPAAFAWARRKIAAPAEQVAA